MDVPSLSVQSPRNAGSLGSLLGRATQGIAQLEESLELQRRASGTEQGWGGVEKAIGKMDTWLVVWLPFFMFPLILGIITSIDFHIFQRGGPTTNQI